jgi:allophanate hydrolase
MTDAIFRVIQAGPLITVQDSGRPNLMRYGVPNSGAMDRQSLAIANAVLGNTAHSPAIEVSVAGLSLECIAGTVTLALVGGGFRIQAGDQSLGSWNRITVHKGDRITIKPGPWGSWTYLAFAGHLEAASWLGSVATHSQSGFGGGKIATGDQITIKGAEAREELVGEIPFPISARARHDLRIVLGPQDRFFSGQALHSLVTEPFRLTDSYDRMGVRLRGPALKPDGALSIPSEAILRGSIQVSGDGTATVLLSDHQTTGGYPKIATLIEGDIDSFCQLRPRDEVRFSVIAPKTAIAVARSRAQAMGDYFNRLRRRIGN